MKQECSEKERQRGRRGAERARKVEECKGGRRKGEKGGGVGGMREMKNERRGVRE